MSQKIIWVEIIWAEFIWVGIIWVEIIWNVTEPSKKYYESRYIIFVRKPNPKDNL